MLRVETMTAGLRLPGTVQPVRRDTATSSTPGLVKIYREKRTKMETRGIFAKIRPKLKSSSRFSQHGYGLVINSGGIAVENKVTVSTLTTI